VKPPHTALEVELKARTDQVELLHRQVDALKRDLEVKNAFLTSITSVEDGTVRSNQPSNLVEFPPHVGVANRAGYKIVDRIVFIARRTPGFLWVRRFAVSYVRRR
jgi:hypothetical protein